jgi:hypothetical protein
MLRRGRPQAEQGMLGSTLGAIVLLLFSSAALVAGSLNWQAASSRGGDTEQAREAAEWGFNTLVDRLNQPGNSFLLVSKWSTASSPPNWLDNASNRTSCGITTDSRGAVDRSQLISGSQTVPGRQVRYRLTNFVPPNYPNNTVPASLPQTCKDNFGNLAGGTVRFTVVGEVLQNGNVIASHRIVRDATVDALADASFDLNQSPDFGGVAGGAPVAPAMTFLATGSGVSSFVSLSSADETSKRPEFLYDRNNNLKKDGSDDQVERLFCIINCDGSDDLLKLANAKQKPKQYTLEGMSPDTFLKLFPGQPPIPAGLSSGSINITAGNKGVGVNRCFPFTRSAPNNTSPCTQSPLTNCTAISLSTKAGPLEEVIACRVRFSWTSASTNNQFIVRNDLTAKPVVLYLIGEGTHEIPADVQIINKRFADSLKSEPSSWSTLRIFGDPDSQFQTPITKTTTISSAKECNNNKKQTIKINKDVSVQGAFMWIPNGEITFEDYSSSSGLGFYGAIWTCKSIFKENFAILNSASPDEVRRGIDKALGLVGSAIPARYAVRGVERSQWGGE